MDFDHKNGKFFQKVFLVSNVCRYEVKKALETRIVTGDVLINKH